jgi:hypothetical protein
MSNIKHKTREAWLEAAVACVSSLFKQHGYSVPPVRVACGWPVRGGLGKRIRVLGECWNKDAATDNTPQIFISPWLVETASIEPSVLPTLVHEVVHAVVGHKEKHNKVFGKCARAVGLEGKLTATHAGETLLTECKSWLAALGEYPHAKLDGLKEPSKKQSTRLLKAECHHGDGEDICGYTCRITRKWLDEVGAPHCPLHGEMNVAEPEAKGDEDNE